MFFCSDKKKYLYIVKNRCSGDGFSGRQYRHVHVRGEPVQGCHYDIANKTNYLLGSTPTSGRFGTFDRIYRLFKKIYSEFFFFICDKHF